MFEDEKKEEINFNTLIKWSWVILVLVGWWLYHGKYQMMYDKASVYAVAIFVSAALLMASWKSLENATRKLIYDYGFTTTIGEYIPVGNYAIYTMGDIRAYDFELRGSKGTVICPKWAISKVGPNVVANASFEEVPWDKLDETIQIAIKKYNLKEPYLMGWANPEELHAKQKKLNLKEIGLTADELSEGKSPTVAFLVKLIKEKNRENTFLRKQIRTHFKDVGSALQFARNAQDTVAPKNTAQKVLDTILGKKNGGD